MAMTDKVKKVTILPVCVKHITFSLLKGTGYANKIKIRKSSLKVTKNQLLRNSCGGSHFTSREGIRHELQRISENVDR